MSLILHVNNNNKILESQFIPKYININKSIKTETIIYDVKKNINNDVIKAYNNNPDLLIINFPSDKNKIDFKYIKNIPRYPIFINDTFYITPICYQQINGFSNDNNNKQFLINDFIERIKRILGGIISDKDFKFQNITYLNMDSGIKSIMHKDIQQNWFVNKIPKWMTTNIEHNNVGWLSSFNKLAIDHIFEYYNINTIGELGAYYGLSTKYIANKNKKNTIYSFDLFDNILLTNYVIKNITTLDTNYFFRYIKFESFHSKISDFDNIYSVKYDCFKAPDLLNKYNIQIDLFYIDFCKKDKLLIQFVDNLFKLYPNCIIIGDDASMLSSALEYFKNKYNYIFLTDCYICGYKTTLKNIDILLEKYNKEKQLQTTEDIDILKKSDIDYRIKYIAKLINQNKSSDEIIKKIDILNINPNTQSHFLVQHSNLFHHIAFNSIKNIKYYSNLYNNLNDKYPDTNILNNLNLTPNDYFNDELNSAFS
jgi:hypothetical protein